MKKYLVYSILFIFIISCGTFAIGLKQDSKTPKVQSTEGIEVTQDNSKNIDSGKTDKKEARQRARNRNKFVRNLHKIERYENNKRIKNRDKDFYESRLNIKKHKLEELRNDSEEKIQNRENTINFETDTNSENNENDTDINSEVKNEKGEN